MNSEALSVGLNRGSRAAVPEHPRWSKRVRAWWLRILRLSRRAPRRLRLCESLPLGERRFVAVIEFEQSRFLVGGTSGSLVLLARLEGRADETPAANEQDGDSGKELG